MESDEWDFGWNLMSGILDRICCPKKVDAVYYFLLQVPSTISFGK